MCLIILIYNKISNDSEAVKALMFQDEVFLALTPCGVMGGYQHFRGSCYLHLHLTRRHNKEYLDLKHKKLLNLIIDYLIDFDFT